MNLIFAGRSLSKTVLHHSHPTQALFWFLWENVMSCHVLPARNIFIPLKVGCGWLPMWRKSHPASEGPPEVSMDVKLWPLQIWYTIRHCSFLETVLDVTIILTTLYWHIDECTSMNTPGCGCCLELLILVSAKWYPLSDSISLGCVSTNNLTYVWQVWRFQSH